MSNILFVALGGALGASGRYLVGMGALRLLGPGFPWGTLTVNIVGSFLIGVLAEVLALKVNLSNEMRLLLVSGFLGGFTTFSAFSLDVAVMVERKAHVLAGGYILASVAGSILAIFLGLWAARAGLH